MKGIVVGVDGSEGAAAALRFAVREGEIRQLPVTAVMAWGLLSQHRAVISMDYDWSYDTEAAEIALKTYIHEALPESKFDQVQAVPVEDQPMPALLGQTHDADMLVVGSRGLSSFKGLMLGSISTQCAHHARCPVVLVNPDWSPPGLRQRDRIVVGADGTPSGKEVVQWAVAETKARRGQLEIVNAWQVPNAATYPYFGVGFEPGPFETASQRILREARDESGAAELEEPVVLCGVNQSAPDALLEHAKDADLLVVGSRGGGGFAGLLLGSVSHKVIHGAGCPVAVIPIGRV
jgi:nucleotide-binding universal stress UspA family protein